MSFNVHVGAAAPRYSASARRVVAGALALALLLSLLARTPAHAVADTWTTGNPMNVGRTYFASATSLDGRVFAFGGNSVTAAPSDYLNTVSSLDPTLNWTAAPPMSVGRSDLAAAHLRDGRIVVI